MRIIYKPFRAGFCLALVFAALTAVAAPKNILFILADDQRDDVLGCYGNDLIQTPTLDGLAAKGVRFENFYCQTPICATSRATIIAGLTQRTHGYNFGEAPVPEEFFVTSYPALLKANGYRVGFAGKFGFKFEGKKSKELFDVYKPIDRNPYLKVLPDGTVRHETDLCADAAIAFIESTPEGQPFCMSVSFNASHAEDKDRRPGYHFQWPESTDGLYEELEIPQPRLVEKKYFKALPPFIQDVEALSRERYFWRWDTPEKYQTNMRAYFRMITGIDQAVARIINALKEQGIADNTIIIYTADNGFMMGDRGLAGKWNHYEQSLRIPFIVYDPTLPEAERGRVIRQPRSLLDVAPSIAAWAGLNMPEVYQGHSLVGLVSGTESDGPGDVYCEHMFKRYNDWRGVCGGRYKYAVYYEEPDGPYEILYDLEKDPAEFTNLEANPEYAQVKKTMAGRLSEYQALYEERRGRTK